jgi:hypothetical protein
MESTKLIRNTQPAVEYTQSRTTAGPITLPNNPLEKVSYHIQAAMQEMRDDPPGSLEFEQHCTMIYTKLYEAMNLLVSGPPRPPSCLQSDLDDVMGGADGTAKLSEVQDEPSTPE